MVFPGVKRVKKVVVVHFWGVNVFVMNKGETSLEEGVVFKSPKTVKRVSYDTTIVHFAENEIVD